MIEDNITQEFISISGDGIERPVLFPYSIIPAISKMKTSECKTFLYLYRLINGFKDRESIIVGHETIGDAIGIKRKAIIQAVKNLSSSTDGKGELKHAFLERISRGHKKAYEYRIAFPGCSSKDIYKADPDSIENYMFSIPMWFFNGYIDNENVKKRPIMEWSLMDIQIFFRICAFHAQKEFGTINLKQITDNPMKLNSIILPAINQRLSRVTPSVKSLHKIGLIHIQERKGNDDYIFNVIPPRTIDYNSGRQYDDCIIKPELTHAKPELTHAKPELTHGVSGEPKPRMTHVKPKKVHAEPAEIHSKPEMTHSEPETTHIDSVVVVSLKNTTTIEPTPVDENFIVVIKETGDEINCTITEAIDDAVQNTTQEIENVGRYKGGLRKRSKNGVVINGDGAIHLDIANYIRPKINKILKERTHAIREQIKEIRQGGMVPGITDTNGHELFVQKIDDEIMVLSESVEDGSPRKRIYGNELSLYLITQIQDIRGTQKIKEETIFERIKDALDGGKDVDLFSKKEPRIKIVDHVGTILITVKDGEKNELDENGLIKLGKPIALKGPGYQVRINGKFA